MWRLAVAALTLVSFLVPAARAATFELDGNASKLEVHVGRAGLFKMFGHDHRIRATVLSGTVSWDARHPESAAFTLEVDAASLRVVDEDEDEEDRVKIQGEMETKALGLPEHRRITFSSTEVRVRGVEDESYQLLVAGELTLRGVSRRLEVPLTLRDEGERLDVRGVVELSSKRWGVPQIRALGGSVKTKDELEIRFELVALAE